MVQETKATFVLRLRKNTSFYVQIPANHVGIMQERCRKRHSYTCLNLLTVNGLNQLYRSLDVITKAYTAGLVLIKVFKMVKKLKIPIKYRQSNGRIFQILKIKPIFTKPTKKVFITNPTSRSNWKTISNICTPTTSTAIG